MFQNKKAIEKKWGFMKRPNYSIGILTEAPADVSWMDSTPYEDARKRMIQADVETLILEFIEMMWCIEPNYYELKSILNTEFYRQNEDDGIVITYELQEDTIQLLSEIKILLDQEDKTIRMLTLYVREQPQFNVLQQKLDEVSSEFIVTQHESSVCIQWQGKQVIVNVEL